MKARSKASSEMHRIPMGEPKSALGNAIRTQRKKLGLTLVELAEKAAKEPRDVKIVSNQAGITGGIRLWDADVEWAFCKRAIAARRRGRTPKLGQN